MNRLLTLEHVMSRARLHAIHAERYDANPDTVSMQPCPNCNDGYDALAVSREFGIDLVCYGCRNPDGITDALLADPEETVAHSDGFQTFTPAELLAMPAPVWLVEPFIREGCITELFGAFGTFKSFTAAAWAARTPGLAVYGSAEGSPHDLGKTFAAWEHAAGRPSGVACIPHAVNMLDQDDADRLAATLRGLEEPVRLLVIDTLARNMPGGNENSPEDMGRFVGVLDAIRAEFKCACLVLHHSGHDHTERGRGHSSWPSAVDVSVRLEKTGTPLEAKLTCTKMRGAAAFDPLVVRLEPMHDTLVLADVVDVRGALDRRVGAYMDKHPDASQNDIERNIKGASTDEKRLSYQRVRLVRLAPGAPQGAGAPLRPPLRGAQAQPLDPTLDPDEHMRLEEDDGW